jgi:membrane protein DedA with SNARE-associated domain
MDQLGLVAIVALMAVKEAGVPIPVPGDLVVIGAGAAAAAGRLDPVVALPAIILATVAGGLVQYVLVRGGGRRIILAALDRLGVTSDRLEPVTGRLRRAGLRGVAVARATPGLRILAIPSAAIAPVAAAPFAVGLAVGNGAFTAAHFGLGMVLGPGAAAVVGGVGPAVIVLVAGLGAVGLVGWLVLGRRRDAPPAIPAWTDAACPACLLLGAYVEEP